MNLILLVLAGIFVNNYVMSQFLGICPSSVFPRR